MLATEDLTIRFGGHAAVDGVSCAFQPGTLTSIVGPNGAGKTTYFNLISGQLPATSGKVRLNGEDITFYHAPRARPRLPAHQPLSQSQRARECAPGGASEERQELRPLFAHARPPRAPGSRHGAPGGAL